MRNDVDDLEAGGSRLWSALIENDAELANELNPYRVIAIEACRMQDKCDQLLEICKSEPPVVDNGRGQPIAHPAWVESRKYASCIGQLLEDLGVTATRAGDSRV